MQKIKQVYAILKRALPFLYVFLTLFSIVFSIGIVYISSQYAEKRHDISGSEYMDIEMAVPASPPQPLESWQIKTSKYKAELMSVYNQPEKVAYLTFDDGPSVTVTPRILDILKEYNIQATFFVLGSYVKKYPNITKRIADEGHIIANHTYSHVYNHIYANTSNLLNEIKQAESIILSTVDEESYVKIFRFPGGSHGSKKNSFKAALSDIGYYFVDWNVINADAEGHNVSPTKQLENIRKTSAGKRNAVVLMHDASSKKTTVDALPAIINYLKSQGYVFRTLKDVPLA